MSLTLQEAAERAGVHYLTVYRWVRTGRLPATKAEGTWAVRL
ncbi:MAG: helix-turn-helix domain-containing protein, partial [Acidimicrobiales bacterium]